LDELPGTDALDWTVLQSMLTANAETTRAMETYVARTQYRDDDPALEPVREHLEEALAHHETVVDQLEFALEALDERADVAPAPTSDD
jgi:DNA-binding ferritin-like protein